VEVVSPAERTRVCVSGSAEAFAEGASRWLGYRPTVERVDLRSVGQAF
jgi:glutamate racemase